MLLTLKCPLRNYLGGSTVTVIFAKGGPATQRKLPFLIVLTRKDVGRLFVEAFANVDLDTMLSVLDEARRTKLRPEQETEQVPTGIVG